MGRVRVPARCLLPGPAAENLTHSRQQADLRTGPGLWAQHTALLPLRPPKPQPWPQRTGGAHLPGCPPTRPATCGRCPVLYFLFCHGFPSSSKPTALVSHILKNKPPTCSSTFLGRGLLVPSRCGRAQVQPASSGQPGMRGDELLRLEEGAPVLTRTKVQPCLLPASPCHPLAPGAPGSRPPPLTTLPLPGTLVASKGHNPI